MNIFSKELLLYHLDHTYAHAAVSPSLSSAVRGLTPDQAAWKPSAARHSIWQIVRHAAHWKGATLSALDGSPVDYNAWNKADWQDVSGSQRDWDRDVEQLRLVSAELRASSLLIRCLSSQGAWGYWRGPHRWPACTRLPAILLEVVGKDRKQGPHAFGGIPRLG